MKSEMINSIAVEINQYYKAFRDQVVMEELNENGLLCALFQCYKEKFFPGTGKKEFASIYSQTVIFFLLSVVLFNTKSFRGKDLKKILLNFNRQVTGIDSFIDDIFKSISMIEIPEQLITFIIKSKEKLSGPGTSGLRDDDILAVLYERFLKRYEPGLHKRIRYYYTPRPVVSFMVHGIDNLIKEKLNINEGISDLNIQILDPAFGTGNFLSAVIQLAIEEKTKKYGEGIRESFIESYLTKNIHGFEIMPPLYLMGYLNIIKKSFCSGNDRGQKTEDGRRKTEDRRRMKQLLMKSFCGGIGSVNQWVSGSVAQKEIMVEGEKLRSSKRRLKASIPGVLTTFSESHNIRHPGAFPAYSVHSKKPSGGPKGLIGPPCHGAGGNLYLSDALENKGRDVIVKKKMPIGVIFCNPPYSRHSLSKGEWIKELVKDYLFVKGRRIEEKNLKGLGDDYVKFFRFAQLKIHENGEGVMGFVTNHAYLDNPTFRGMRHSLIEEFNEIYILNLHGNAMKKEKCPDGSKDENIFDILQGVAISLFIKKKKAGTDCKVFYADIWGPRQYKYDQLLENNINTIEWKRIFPDEEFYLFTPAADRGLQTTTYMYNRFYKLTDIFPVHSVGIVTGRDNLTIKASEEEVYTTVHDFSKVDEAFARQFYKLRNDTRDWQVKEAQKDIRDSGLDRNKIYPILYRPFDICYTYYTGKSRGFLCMPRTEVMRHMLQENICLITVRQVAEGVFNHCLASDTIVESRVTTSNKGIAYIFPLYIYLYPGKHIIDLYNRFLYIPWPRKPNIHPKIFNLLRQTAGFDPLPSPEQIFYYIYAVLYSTIYREIYVENLRIDFPRVPFTLDYDLFNEVARLGRSLVEIHLMKSPELDCTFSKFPVSGSSKVKTPLFKHTAGGDGRVYINNTQYFSNISLELWEHQVCGHQVLKKWLWDRKGQVLSLVDIRHYIKICRAIQITLQYQEKIDGLYEQLEKKI